MRKNTTGKTRLAYLALAAAAAALPCASLQAQVQLGTLRYCVTLGDSAERLQCFDRAMSLDDAPGLAAEIPASEAAPARAAEPAPELANVAATPAVRPPSPPQESVESVTGTVAAQDLRGDASNPPPAVPLAYQVRVVNIIEQPSRRIVLETEDGRLWTKNSRSIQRYPDPPFVVTIEERSLGSRWMIPADGGRSFRVTPTN